MYQVVQNDADSTKLSSYLFGFLKNELYLCCQLGNWNRFFLQLHFWENKDEEEGRGRWGGSVLGISFCSAVIFVSLTIQGGAWVAVLTYLITKGR